MKVKVKVSGAGGQGILTLGVLLANAAVRAGYEATMISSYGAEMRGGKANAQVIISDKKIASPFIEKPDIGVYFNQLAYKVFIDEHTENTTAFYNSSIIPESTLKNTKGINHIPVPANEIALSLKNPRGVNIVMLGALSTQFDFLPEELFYEVIDDHFAKKGEQVIQKNIECFTKGRSLAMGVK